MHFLPVFKFVRNGIFASGSTLFLALLPTQSLGADPVAETPYIAVGADEIQALAVLEKHCARCHQAGKLENGRAKPAKNFGNILHLDQLLADSSRTKPGNADGSRIFQMLVNNEMPYDVYQEANFEKPSPTKDEVALLRKWLDGANSKGSASCLTGELEDSYVLIAKDIGTLADHEREGARYISLGNLALNCGSPAELEAYRQGTIKLLNSLSTSADPLIVTPVDADKTLLRFNLKDLGWTAETWNLLTGIYPYAVRPANGSYEMATLATGTQIPVIRADWFAFTASRPPIYEQILGLPATFQELQQKLGVDVTANIESFSAKRAGFQKSGVSQNNRLIERHSISTGAFWTSYDFGGNRAQQSLFEFPLGPGGEFGFHHDGGETIFNLPNGLQAYYLNNAKGEALAKGPTQIVRDPSRKDLTVTNGISCIGCHNQGMRNAKDEIRAQVESVKNFPFDVREAIKALYPLHDEMDKVIETDRARFKDALKQSGVDPDLDLNGIEVINALSDRYERELDLKAAAAEFGVSVEDLQRNMTMSGGTGASLVTRLELGTVQRDNFETNFGALVESIIDARYIAPSVGPGLTVASQSPVTDIRIDLSATKSRYAVGDGPVFTARTNRDCHLTLVNVDPHGDAVVIFPNRFQQDNSIKANTEFTFPNAQSNFDFQFSTKGTETVIAICDEGGSALTGIAHDYATEALTGLGNGALATKKIDVVARNTAASGQSVGRAAIKLKVE